MADGGRSSAEAGEPDAAAGLAARLTEFRALLEAAASSPPGRALPAIRELRRAWLEDRETGVLPVAFARLRTIAEPSARAAWGAAANRLKREVEASVAAALEAAAPSADSALAPGAVPFDPTMPGRSVPVGSVHPLTIVRREVERVFAGLGFEVEVGPEVEDEEHNFEGLNIPQGHPARDPGENLRLPGGWLLRSQTSPVQVRTLRARKPPLRVLAPGRVYRPDTVDARHLYAFHQVEGLCVAEGIGMSDLKGTLGAFAEGFYGSGVSIRFRPSYFPFTEPSAEMDVGCPACQGATGAARSCSTCGGEGWMELLGCGLVHPDVLLRAGVDPERWTGFAFGMGLERAAMRRWSLADIRCLVENDVRFLEQFR